jgi:hypothetical protein
MFETTASTVLTLAVVRGALMLEGVLVLRGVLVLEGALEGERFRALEDPTSRLRGGNLTPRYYCLDVLILRMQV